VKKIVPTSCLRESEKVWERSSTNENDCDEILTKTPFPSPIEHSNAFGCVQERSEPIHLIYDSLFFKNKRPSSVRVCIEQDIILSLQSHAS
jgi:hypothetical protein